MRLWHLTSNRWNSAITEYALSAARALEARGHETLFTPLEGSPAERRAREAGLLVRPLAKFAPAEMAMVRGIAHDFEPQAIFVYGGPEAFLAGFAGGRPRPRCVRFRGQELRSTGFLETTRQRLSHRGVDVVVTPGASLSAKMRRVLPQTARVETVTLGCDLERYFRVAGARSMRPEVLIFGRLDPVKGHAAAMKLWRRVLAQWGDAEPRPVLRIVGEPANVTVADLEAAAAREGLRLGDDVILDTVRVADVARLLSQATVGLVPSLGSELIGRVAEEFLLCGTPVVVSGAGSLDEVIFDATAGASYLGLAEEAAAKVLTLWIRTSLAEREDAKMARARAASERFSYAAMGEALEALLKR